MKICPKCNTPSDDSAEFCRECGARLTHTTSDFQTNGSDYHQTSSDQNMGQNTQYQQNFSNQNSYQQAGFSGGYNFGIAPRNIALCILFSIITCGLYSIYWMIKINDEVNQLSGEPTATSGGMVFLFSLITCGIYSLYWMYKMGERCERIKHVPVGYTGILYLILDLVGFGIISYALIQDTLNKAVA